MHNAKKIILLTAAGIFMSAAALFFYHFYFRQAQACFGQICFEVEIADNPIERAKGLMFRKSLAENRGMLFVFRKEDVYPFWMKNTFIPLDIVWIDKDYKAVFIKENAKPCGLGDCPFINPDATARYVLEINAGLVQKFNFKIGDLVEVSPGL